MTSLSRFKLTFQRYEPINGGRIMDDHVTATDFTEAVRVGNCMARAMGDADTKHSYMLCGVVHVGVNGDRAVHGWMTQEEFTASIEVKK
jgi:hypothetical protein